MTALADVGYDVSDVTETDLRTKKLLIRQYSLEARGQPAKGSRRSTRPPEIEARRIAGIVRIAHAPE